MFFYLMSIMSCFIVIWGYVRHIKVSRGLKNKGDIETASKETLDELKVAIRLILIGSIIAVVFRILGILIIHGII